MKIAVIETMDELKITLQRQQRSEAEVAFYTAIGQVHFGELNFLQMKVTIVI